MLLALTALVADGEVLEARFRAAIEGKPDVLVRLEYRLRLPEGTEEIPFSALEIGEVAIENVSAASSGIPLRVEIEPRSGRKLRGVIEIPKGSESSLALELQYVVRSGAETSAGDVRASLPLAILDLALAETGADLFSAAVDVPAALRIVDGFPSNPRQEAMGQYRWDLPLVPTFVSFRATSGSGFLSLPYLASAAVTVLLVVGGFVGIRRARSLKP